MGEGYVDLQKWHGKPIKNPEVLDLIKSQIKNPDAALEPRKPEEEVKFPEAVEHSVGELSYTLG